MPFSKKIFDSHFESYLRRNFPEHARRIIQGRSTANLVRFFYPFIIFSNSHCFCINRVNYCII